MQLSWMKCHGDVWCKLNDVNLDHEHFNNRYGVYIIWHGGTKDIRPWTVYVSQGNIKERIAAHRKDSEIQKFGYLDLYVTWAKVPEEHRDSVEAYLAYKWKPRVGTNHPQAPFIEVNSPWAVSNRHLRNPKQRQSNFAV